LGNEAAADALLEILRRDFAYRWSRLAVLASVAPTYTRRVLKGVLDQAVFSHATDPARLETLEGLAELLGARASVTPADVTWLVEQLGSDLSSAARVALLDGLAHGLERAGVKPDLTSGAKVTLERLIAQASLEEMRALWRVTRLLGLSESEAQRTALTRADEAAANAHLSLEDRLAAVRLLSLGSTGVIPRLLGLLDAREPTEIQSAALSGLSGFRESSVALGLIEQWRVVSPTLRPQILELLLDRRAYHDALLSALEEGRLQVGELNLDLEQRRRLLRGGTAEIRQRASKFMGDEEYSNRKALVNDWLAKLPAEGDPTRGQQVFLDACAKCHATGALGHRVGPDLTGVAHRSVEDLLSNILDPNMAINPRFVASTLETRDGDAPTGLIEAESSDAITLLQAEGKRVVIPRREIKRIESSGQSLMPEGLEAGKSPQQLRDLIAFLQQPPR
ncbi:MAG TPA: hypothetical protein DCE44_17785, partial [Verrucomicrobiales bacterium]|nr:hypothetical protein [Verrucomicrobiales bacterium]